MSASSAESSRTAAFFDLDGLFFRPDSGWKIRDAHFGQAGERLPAVAALEMFRRARIRQPRLRITDCFLLDEIDFDSALRVELARMAVSSRLLKAAQVHLSHRHDLYILSFAPFADLWRVSESWLPEPRRYPLLENPLRRAGFVCSCLPPLPPEDEPLPERLPSGAIPAPAREDRSAFARSPFVSRMVDDSELRRRAALDKLYLLRNYLRYKADRPEGLQGEDPTRRYRSYDRVRFYYTESAYGELFARLREGEQNLWSDRNALLEEYVEPPPVFGGYD